MESPLVLVCLEAGYNHFPFIAFVNKVSIHRHTTTTTATTTTTRCAPFCNLSLSFSLGDSNRNLRDDDDAKKARRKKAINIRA